MMVRVIWTYLYRNQSLCADDGRWSKLSSWQIHVLRLKQTNDVLSDCLSNELMGSIANTGMNVSVSSYGFVYIVHLT